MSINFWLFYFNAIITNKIQGKMFMDSALLCLNASAGSGKTYRLVLRYLELLFLGAKPSEILTLTFTKKAAKEMEERIAKSIGEIYQYRNDRDYINKLECISIKDKNDFGKLQEKIHQIYHSFLKEDLKITTIDSFFQRILKSFCWYVGVEYDFEIQSDDREKIIEIFLTNLDNQQLQGILNLCIQRQLRIDSVISFCDFLDSLKEMLKKELFIYPAKEGYKQQAMEYARRIQATYQDTKGEIHSALEFDDIESLLQKGKTWLTKERLQDYRGFSKIPFRDEDFRGLKEALVGVFAEDEAKYLENLYGIFVLYLKAKQEYYKQTNTLSFNAVTSKVYELLLQKQIDKNFLYFRLDSTISHILIDEFQDTSVLQYEILKPMIDEIKSGEGAKRFLRSFFYVGDIKQSIYRFRGGNSELFKIAAQGMQEESLKINYRSAKNIVEFVNETFSNKIEGFVPQESNSKIKGFVQVYIQEKEAILSQVATSIRELLEVGAKEEEIAILTFDNDCVVEIAEFLQEEGFKVVVDTSAKLIFHNEVRALIEFLKYLIFENPKFCAEFFMLLGLEKENLEQYFYLKTQKPSKVLLEIMQRYKIASLSAKKFLEYSLEYLSIEELLEKVESLQSDIVSSDFFGIRIMTIHKSKGLEFNNVLIIDDIRAKNRSGNVFFEFKENGVEIKRIFWRSNELRMQIDKEYQKALLKENILKEKDLKNQLYVALTRAKNTMQIILLDQKSRFESLGLQLMQKGELKQAILEIKSANLEDSLAQNKDFECFAHNQKSLESLGRQKQMQIAQKEDLIGEVGAVYYGIALHFVMEQKIKNQLEDSLILTLLLNKMGFYIEKKILEKIINHCKILLNHSSFIEIMGKGKVKCEVPFLINGRQKRLDLLIIGDNEAFVIDYKSGMQREIYKMQVLEYMQSVNLILQKPTYGFIFYTEGEGKLVEVIGD